VFFQNFQRAVEMAKSSYSEGAWSLLTPSERSAAICRELQVVEAQAVKPIIDTWVLQGWYKSLISLSGHGDFAEYVVPRADDIVC